MKEGSCISQVIVPNFFNHKLLHIFLIILIKFRNPIKMVNMNQDYTRYTIDKYILKITGVFNYDKAFNIKALQSDFEELQFSEETLKFSKDYFYPEFRKQFFSSDKARHKILIKNHHDALKVNLFEFKRNSETEIAKDIALCIKDSRLDLFEDGFGMFTLNIQIDADSITLFQYSDACYLTRNFESKIKNSKYEKWHELIENEILLGSLTKGKSVLVDEYSGSKYKLYMVVDIPELQQKETIKPLLFDIGTVSMIGSANGNTYFSMDKDYIKQLVKHNSISVFNNWEGLALLDTFSVVGNKILDTDWKLFTYTSIYHSIYLYGLFIKYELFKHNYDISDLDEDKREDFQDFIAKYYYNYLSYNFLPTEIYNKIRLSLDIEKELNLLNEKIVAVGQRIQEEQQDRTNKILGIVTVLSSLSSAQPVYDYLIIGQKILGWNVAFYWTVTISIVLLLIAGIAFYVFGRNILKWIKKRKK